MLDLRLIFDPDRPPTVALTPVCLSLRDLPPDWYMLWDERAAIMEYDGGLPREHAEAMALADICRLMEEHARKATAVEKEPRQESH